MNQNIMQTCFLRIFAINSIKFSHICRSTVLVGFYAVRPDLLFLVVHTTIFDSLNFMMSSGYSMREFAMGISHSYFLCISI